MKWRVNNFQLGGVCDQLPIENQRLEPVHVSSVHFFADCHDPAGLLFRDIVFVRDGIDLSNDAARMRFNYLRPIIEIDLVAVIVRRVVARRDYNARGRI